MMAVTNSVQRYRIDYGLSQNQLAYRILHCAGVTPLSFVENGHVLPTKEMLNDLCSIFCCTPTDLYAADDIDLLSCGGGLTDGSKKIVVKIKPEVTEALNELGYANPEEWLKEAERKLLMEMHLQRISRHSVTG